MEFELTSCRLTSLGVCTSQCEYRVYVRSWDAIGIETTYCGHNRVLILAENKHSCDPWAWLLILTPTWATKRNTATLDTNETVD